MKHLKLKSFFLTLLLVCAIGQAWASVWIDSGSQPTITINGTSKGASSLTNDNWGTQTDLCITYVHWFGKRNNKDTDGMWGEGKFTYGISGTTGTASAWNDIVVSDGSWYDNYCTYEIDHNINFQLCSNRLPGDYELYFYFRHRTGNDSYVYYSNSSNNYHIFWNIPNPTISFESNHTPVEGQPVTLNTAVSAWPYGMTIKSVVYKHNGTTISTQTTGDLSTTSYTHTPTVSGSGKYTVHVTCTFGTAGDVTYDYSMDVTPSYTVTYGSHTNGSFTIGVPNKAVASSNQPAASGQRVDISASGNTGYEFSSWDVYKTGTPATKITPNGSTASTYFTMPAYAVTVDATFVGKHYDVTLNTDNGNGTSAIYPQYTASMPSTLKGGSALSAPTYSGYDFQGYFDDHAGAGTQYYTSAMSSANNWDKTSTATLYAKWTQTVELDANGGSSDGSVVAVYKGTAGTPSAPTYTDHSVDLGYYAEPGCTNKVMNLDGSLNNYTDYVVSNTWQHTGASTLYAHWKVNAPSTISCTDNVVTIAVPTGATVHYTIDGSDPTSSSATYDPSNKPVITEDVTVKAIATQTGCTTSDITSQDVTYTPVYDVDFTTNNASKTSGDATVLENHEYIATYTTVTGYDLPSDVTVTINGNTATKGSEYTWSAGTLTIKENEIDGDVTITVNGVAKSYTGTINANGGSTAGTYTATYNANKITINTEPVYAGYEVEGYYLNPETSIPIADASGNLVSVAQILEPPTAYVSSYKWIYDDDDLVIYPKWIPKSYTITLDANRGGISGTDGSTTFKVTSGTNNYDFDPSTDGKQDCTIPSREGYTFAGYYTSVDGSTQVISDNGSLVGGVSGYTAANSNWTNTTDDLTLYAHWTVTSTYVFKGGASGNETSWSTAANWTKGVAPSANDGSENIIILAPVEIPASATTNVNSVRIGSAGSYTLADGTTTIDADGKLTIPATAMLKVTNDVKNYDFDEEKDVNTTTSTLHIESASSGNGALVWGAASSTPGRAQVDFYTKSGGSVNSTASINQYIGTPFSDAIVVYNYYDSWTFKINAAGTAWERLEGNGTMYPFVGYDVIYNGDPGHIYQMDGTLVTNADRTCSLTFTTDGAENLLANSWTAPMWIKGFANDDFTNADAAIYIFNSTSEDDSNEDVSVGGGNYSTYTPGTSDEYIPSMQSFSVLSTGGTGSVKLNYTNLVKTPASHSHIGAMHAPRRVDSDEIGTEQEGLEPKMDFLRLRVDDENGWADELKIYIREDFVEEFENGFDARKMYGDNRAPMLYGISPDGHMAINCIPTADNHVVGFHAGDASNEYTFRFTYDGEDELYLRDNKTGIETRISEEETYSFTSQSGDTDLRFSIIRKAPAVPTDIETVTGEGLQTTGVQKIMYNGMLYILRSGRIYDATGAVVK